MTSSVSSQSSLLGSIYPDELLWSYRGRLRERFRGFDLGALLGAEPSYRKAFPTQLARLANAFAYEGAPSVGDLIENHTFYKFALPEISSAAAAQLAHSISDETFPSRAPQPLVHQSHFELRLCPCCMAEDQSKFGVAYWHRLHQLPALTLCYVHGTALHTTKIFAGQRKFVTPAAAGLEMREIPVSNLVAQQALASAYQCVATSPDKIHRRQTQRALEQLLAERRLLQQNRISLLLLDQIEADFGSDAVRKLRPVEQKSRLSGWLSVDKLAMICAAVGMPFEAFFLSAARVPVEECPSGATTRERRLLAQVERFAPIVAARLKREPLRVSAWALANTLKPQLGPGFAANDSWKPAMRAALKAHAETPQQFQNRIAQAA